MLKIVRTLGFVLALAPAAALACPGMDKDEPKAKDEKSQPAPKDAVQASLHVEGMHCEGCASHVSAALKKLKGVYNVNVVVKDKRAKVQYDAKQVKTDDLVKTLKAAGFTASLEA